MHTFIQGVAEADKLNDTNLLLTQEVERAGIYSNGTIAGSVTDAVTRELESARSKRLGKRIESELERTDYERWAWEAWTKMSTEFLLSPPDAIGYMEDPIVQVAFTTYLGQPCLLIAPVAGRFFGKNGAVFDQFGANLAAAPLMGSGHQTLHNLLQSLVQNMRKVAGIASEKEAVNFLLDKVGEPYILRYVSHVSAAPNARKAPHAIVPDIHALNFSTGKQRVNDSGATTTAEAFFEMKTYTACKSRYQYNNTTRNPADRRATEVSGAYSSKFRKLDRLFAAEVVGEGDHVVGPFSAAQARFFRGQAIPLYAGWFGEVNEDLRKIIRTLAKEAAAGDDGMTISPLINSDRKGGAFAIMHQQFKRAVGVAVVRGNAKHKLGRLHYVRATPEEAAAVCRAHHSDNRWKPSQNGRASWYAEHVPEGYGTFEQFRNGYRFYVH